MQSKANPRYPDNLLPRVLYVLSYRFYGAQFVLCMKFSHKPFSHFVYLCVEYMTNKGRVN